MMDLAMNFDTDEYLVTAMFDKGNRNDTMEAIDNIIPFLKGDIVFSLLITSNFRPLPFLFQVAFRFSMVLPMNHYRILK